MSLTPEERQRIYEEEKARIEARTRIEADARRQAEAKSAESLTSSQQMLAIILFILVCCGGVWFYNEVSKPAPSMETSSTPYAAATVVSPPAIPVDVTPPPVRDWSKVKVFKGSSTKDTETFSITGEEWRVRWKTKPGEYGDMNFQIYINNADGSPKGVVANIIGAGHDESIMRGSGPYYLSINTAQPYVVEIDER